MSEINQRSSCTPKREKSEDSVSRAHSQDALDSSSASSLSFFADHSDVQNSGCQSNERNVDGPKSGECSPSKVPMDEALKSEKAFIEFVMSLPPKDVSEQHHRSTDSVSPKSKSPAASGNATKVGLDHLDNLCKLMEQLSDLRETNNKLQRRVQYLEDLKTLHDMHKEINEEVQYSSEDALTTKPRPYELKKSATESCCPKKEEMPALHSYRNNPKYQSRRSRAQSTDGQRRERSKSVGHDDSVEDTKSKRIFPKWSKVKEAFGWESERKDSVKVKGDSDAGSVRTPRRCSEDSRQSYHHTNSPSWSHTSLHSSLEDIHEIFDAGRWKRASIASEKNVLHLETPKEVLRRQKSTPSPGSEKIMAFREATDLKPKSSTIERDTYSHQDFKDDGKRGKSPWGRVKTIIERRRDSLKRRSLRREHIYVECDSMPPKKDADTKSYTDFLDSSSAKQPVLSDSYKHKHFGPEPIVIDQEVDYGGPRTPSSSPTFQRKSRWTRVKKALKGKKEDEKDPSLSTPASPNSVQDDHFTFDAIEEISQDSFEEGREIKRVGSDSHVHQLVLSEPTCDLMLQLQRNLSEDFHRKIMEWERMRSSGTSSCSPHWDRKPSVTVRSRKKSERDDKNIKPKLKDLTWLEKELQKIEKEKQRLSKERQKYEERALRLEKLKETVLKAKNSNKREVLVRTSAGEFRFEGISDAFTKKLYEWETKRGVGPELSTIALLDSSRLMVQPNIGSKSGPLQRVVSRSESSVADIGQPSHNSSNSLPSLKVPDTMESERANQPSRANSEPDLSTLVALTNGTNVSVSNLSRQVGDSLDDEITASPGVSRESEEDELDKKRNDSETYYGLLEENVILLEQLKDKEEICRRLESELDVLDKKVDVMNKHHTQETERYREKLWEMHKPGATPRDVQCCLRTMAQLRKRIEVLEKCTEKLRNDRDSVEDSFRYHSKQQEDMTLDLLQKMSELQAAGSTTAECETNENIPPHMNVSVVEKLQDLSALLVKQTQELQETLAAKTRQISQLRWELLHRDLSTVKLETELHTHTAHRKRSKYAHYRSHSSEEAPVVSLTQELDHGKSAIITEAYYNSMIPESEFQATQLTNTVQQLSRELLKLANAAEYPTEDVENAEPYEKRTNPEESWAHTARQHKNRDKSKQITVRRSSADNISLVPGKDGFKQNVSSSVDSDDSSDDGYTKISFHSCRRGNFGLHPNAERLLMSSGEHPPRGYLQRRKKLQKSVKGSSSPNRRRSNTFHNKRDFEKPIIVENIPQKCHSFRYPTEKIFEQSRSRNIADTINIRTLLGEVKYREFLKRRAQMCRNSHGQTAATNKTSQNVTADNKSECQWLREVASDSKIPLLFQVQYRSDEFARNKHGGKCPVRSMSDKQRKETAAERRENFQKRSKKQLTSPDLFSYLNEKSNRINYSHQRESKGDSINNTYVKDSTTKSENHEKSSKSQTNIPSLNTGTASIMIQLPRRKSKKSQRKLTDDKTANTEQSATVMPQKRSLSSEQEFENSVKGSINVKASEDYKQIAASDRAENPAMRSFADSQLFKEKNISNIRSRNDCKETGLLPNENHEMLVNDTRTENETFQNEQMSRKRKANDCDALLKDPNVREMRIASTQEDRVHNIKSNTIDGSLTDRNSFISGTTGCMKSPSAPHLDWRRVCAKKISRDDTSTVKSLIEKYNRVAESQSIRSSTSNIKLTSNRKISSPLFNSKSGHAIASHSFSTPTTPSIMSASAFYNPLIFKPVNLDLFSRSPPASPDSMARNEAIKKAKEQFISSQGSIPSCPQTIDINDRIYSNAIDGNITSDNRTPTPLNTTKSEDKQIKKPDDDRISNCSMDSMRYVMFRTGETCKESRLSKRSVDYSKTDSDTLERNKLKPSKSLSNSSIFKTVLSSDFKIPASLMKLKRSKRKKEMATVSHLCRQSLLLSTEDTEKVSSQSSHKSCPSSPELKSKNEVKSSWFHRNILRHK